MKLKLMPVLTGVAALALVAIPLVVKAAPVEPGQQLLAQATGQRRQGNFANLNLTQDQKDKIRQMGQDTQREIEGVLTPEQLDQYKKARQSRRSSSMRNGNGNLASAGALQRNGRSSIMDSLNLSSSQKSQIQEIRQRSRERMMSILNDQQRQQLQQRGGFMRNPGEYMRNPDE